MVNNDLPVHSFDSEISVIMLPGHALAYQRWLHENGLYLFRIPGSSSEIPEFAVGV